MRTNVNLVTPWRYNDYRPEGPSVNSHAREGVGRKTPIESSAEGATVQTLRLTIERSSITAPTALGSQ